MHKRLKLASVIIILNLILLTTPAQGSFGVDVGQKYKFKVIDSYTGGYYDYLTSDFAGFTFSSLIIPTPKIHSIYIESVSASSLAWNSTLNNVTVHGSCPSPVDLISVLNWLIIGYNLPIEFSIIEISSSGEIEPYYLPAFTFPLFVDAAPATWDTFDLLYDALDSSMTGISGMFSEFSYEATKIESVESYTMNLWFIGTLDIIVEPTLSIYLYSNSTFTYDKTLGMLKESENIGQYNGTYTSDNFSFRLHHQVVQTDISDVMQFIVENKWYFIGGGSGLAALILLVIFFGIRKRKR
ncbi:MAG: hypothetical protein FK734_02820 [Asgard group archaeon]|nr:hypothetical protein [Asgard group archaeon]